MERLDKEDLEYLFEERAGILEEIYPKDMAEILAKREIKKLTIALYESVTNN